MSDLKGQKPLRGYLGAESAEDDRVEICPGDVILFAHGSDAPMLQVLHHPAAIEDWNGKLRPRVRAIYRKIWGESC